MGDVVLKGWRGGAARRLSSSNKRHLSHGRSQAVRLRGWHAAQENEREKRALFTCDLRPIFVPKGRAYEKGTLWVSTLWAVRSVKGLFCLHQPGERGAF